MFPKILSLASRRAGRLGLALAAAAAVAAPAAAAPPGLTLAPADRAALIRTLAADGQAADGLGDAALFDAAAALGRRELGQRLEPSQIDRFWALAAPRQDVAGDLAAALAKGGLAAWLADLSPGDPRYAALREARRRYAALAAAGGWPQVPEGPTLRTGERDPRVAALRRRLQAEGYVPGDGPGELFDPRLTAGVMAFQVRHGLEADGVAGPRTLAALNVTAEARVAQIDANLERWRWLPHTLPADRLEVDVGGAAATLFRAGAPDLTMRAIVGDPQHETPMFASRLEAVVFNPPWNVPDSIARAEILPKAARDPGYLARNHFAWVDGRLQQRPGPDNALGQLKFDLPSPFGVYLHDTPGKAAFQRADRALSHGCMRLEKPRPLAVELLAAQGWTAEQVEAAIAAGETRRIGLNTPLPLFVVYWTAVPEPSGAVDFRPDVYGWDAKLTAALGGSLGGRAGMSRLSTDCTDAS